MASIATMKEIAGTLGVSRTTVSLVLKGEGNRYRIATSTQQRIQDHVRRVGFKPNYFASHLTRKRTGTIGLVFPDLFDDFMSQGLRGIEDAIMNADLIPFICSARFNVAREERQIEELLHRGVDGLVIAPTACFRGRRRSLHVFRRIQEEGTPMVFLDRRPSSLRSVPWVRQDDFGGGQLAAQAVVAQGCRTPAYIGFDLGIATLPDRLRGFAEGLKGAGIALPSSRCLLLKEANPHAYDIESALQRWFRSAQKPDGLFVSTSGLAVRCRSLLHKQGVVAGRDVFVIRFGPSERHAEGCLQGILQPHRAMGCAAAGQLCAWIQSGTPPKTNLKTLPVTLDEKP